jgi:hypothetical protein
MINAGNPILLIKISMNALFVTQSLKNLLNKSMKKFQSTKHVLCVAVAAFWDSFCCSLFKIRVALNKMKSVVLPEDEQSSRL